MQEMLLKNLDGKNGPYPGFVLSVWWRPVTRESSYLWNVCGIQIQSHSHPDARSSYSVKIEGEKVLIPENGKPPGSWLDPLRNNRGLYIPTLDELLEVGSKDTPDPV